MTCHLLKLVPTNQIIININPIRPSGINAMDVSLIYKHDWEPVNFILSGWSQVDSFALVFFHLKLRYLPILLKSMFSLTFMSQQLLEQFPPVHIQCRGCIKQDINQCYFSYSLRDTALLARHCSLCSTHSFRILLIVLSDTPVAFATLFYSFPISLTPLYLYFLPLFS
jgi:hypothetical protein